MARSAEPADDPTPLTAARLDMTVRVGWLVRTWREAGRVSLREMSAGLAELGTPYSAATLSRIERQGVRPPAVLDGYATVLGLPAGTVRSGVDMACGYFRYGPVSGPEPRAPDLASFTAACDAVLDVDDPSGGAWLAFARLHAAPGGFGLPRSLMVDPVRRLTDEANRSAGLAGANRYVALTQLRLSPYDGVLEEVAREMLLEPGAQVVGGWVPAILAYRASRSLLHWFAELLAHDSVRLSRAASHSLQSMLVRSQLPLEAWESITPDLARAWERSAAEPVRREFLRELLVTLPPSIQESRHAPWGTEPAASRAATPAHEWSRSRRNARYELARVIARRACARTDLREEPLLARAVFEALFDPRGVRRSLGRILIRTSPFGPATVDELVAQAGVETDDAIRAALLLVATDCYWGHEMPGVPAWLGSPDPVELRLAVIHEGHRGRLLPTDTFTRALDGDEWTVYRTLQAAAAVDDRRLHRVARDAGRPREQREAAHWWTTRTGLVHEAPDR